LFFKVHSHQLSGNFSALLISMYRHSSTFWTTRCKQQHGNTLEGLLAVKCWALLLHFLHPVGWNEVATVEVEGTWKQVSQGPKNSGVTILSPRPPPPGSFNVKHLYFG
jgi:hypothetical protein